MIVRLRNHARPRGIVLMLLVHLAVTSCTAAASDLDVDATDISSAGMDDTSSRCARGATMDISSRLCITDLAPHPTGVSHSVQNGAWDAFRTPVQPCHDYVVLVSPNDPGVDVTVALGSSLCDPSTALAGCPLSYHGVYEETLAAPQNRVVRLPGSVLRPSAGDFVYTATHNLGDAPTDVNVAVTETLAYPDEIAVNSTQTNNTYIDHEFCNPFSCSIVTAAVTVYSGATPSILAVPASQPARISTLSFRSDSGLLEVHVDDAPGLMYITTYCRQNTTCDDFELDVTVESIPCSSTFFTRDPAAIASPSASLTSVMALVACTFMIVGAVPRVILA